eukprot:Gb_09016 [translate_table: standard]
MPTKEKCCLSRRQAMGMGMMVAEKAVLCEEVVDNVAGLHTEMATLSVPEMDSIREIRKETRDVTPIHQIERHGRGDTHIQIPASIHQLVDNASDQVRPIVTPFIPVEGQSELLDEFEEEGMLLLQHHNCIIQSIPPLALHVFVLHPDHISKIGKYPEKDDIRVDIDPAILIQSGQAKDFTPSGDTRQIICGNQYSTGGGRRNVKPRGSGVVSIPPFFTKAVKSSIPSSLLVGNGVGGVLGGCDRDVQDFINSSQEVWVKESNERDAKRSKRQRNYVKQKSSLVNLVLGEEVKIHEVFISKEVVSIFKCKKRKNGFSVAVGETPKTFDRLLVSRGLQGDRYNRCHTQVHLISVCPLVLKKRVWVKKPQWSPSGVEAEVITKDLPGLVETHRTDEGRVSVVGEGVSGEGIILEMGPRECTAPREVSQNLNERILAKEDGKDSFSPVAEDGASRPLQNSIFSRGGRRLESIEKDSISLALGTSFEVEKKIFRLNQWISTGGDSGHFLVVLELVKVGKRPPSPFKFNPS